MDQVTTSRKAIGWRLIAAVLMPFVVISPYLIWTRWPSYSFTAFSDYAGLGLSVLAGAVFIAILPLRPLHRVLFLIVYIPLFAVMLFFYIFWFIAVVFHDGP